MNHSPPDTILRTSCLTPRLIGAVFVAASAAGFGALAIFVKIAFADGVSTGAMLFLRFSIAGVIMTALMAVCRYRWPRGRDLAILVGMGSLGYVGQAYCYFSALRFASAGLTALLLYLYPALVTLASAALGRRRLTRIQGVAVAAAFSGILLTVSGGMNGTPAGIAFGAGAAVIYTVYILVGEGVTSRTAAIPAATVIMLAAACVYGAAAAVEGARWPETSVGWGAVGAVAVLSTVVAMVGFFAGMRRIGATEAATLSTLEPVVTLLLAAAILGEAVTPLQAAGVALVLAAVVALARAG
jgi:drug/metabolite transporter (DMT)-like permease